MTNALKRVPPKTFLAALAAIALASGCGLKLEKERLAQSVSLEDSIRFTHLTVTGNVVVLEFARAGVTATTGRAGVDDPIDFAEYVTFTKDAKGGLTWIPSQSKIGVNVSKSLCGDPGCNTLAVTLSVVGSTKPSDTTRIVATRIVNLGCDVFIREANGAETSVHPKFETATLTTTEINGKSNGRYALYGKANYSDTETGYRSRVFLRNFLGVPSEAWFDRIDSVVHTDGRTVHVKTAVRTFDAEILTLAGNSLSLFASDVEGRRVTIGCTAPTPITVPIPMPPKNGAEASFNQD